MTQRVKRDKRVMLSLTNEVNDRLLTLAKIERKPPAVVAREIIIDYLESRKDKIDEAQRAADAYHASLKNLRSYEQLSIFPEENL